LGEIVQAISPYFFEIGEAVIGGLWTIAQTTAEKSIEDSFTPKVTAWVGRKLVKPAPLALTAGQIDTIMETIETKVSRMRASKETKQKVLDRIRSALSEGRPDEGHREW
jgi:chaperonin cofactor prefoldin